jgi:hypothetical protein
MSPFDPLPGARSPEVGYCGLHGLNGRLAITDPARPLFGEFGEDCGTDGRHFERRLVRQSRDRECFRSVPSQSRPRSFAIFAARRLRFRAGLLFGFGR